MMKKERVSWKIGQKEMSNGSAKRQKDKKKNKTKQCKLWSTMKKVSQIHNWSLRRRGENVVKSCS